MENTPPVSPLPGGHIIRPTVSAPPETPVTTPTESSSTPVPSVSVPASSQTVSTANTPTSLPLQPDIKPQVSSIEPGAAANVTQSATVAQPVVFGMSPEPNPTTPAVVFGGSSEVSKKRRFSKKLLLLFIPILVLLIGSSAAAYFVVIVPNKPANIWRTALVNSGKGYDKLADYATTTNTTKGTIITGSFKLSGLFATDGSFTGQSDGNNGELTGSISAVGLKVNLDTKVIKSTGTTPDIYFKVDGLQGLGDLLGGDNQQYASALNGLNGQWYVIDHTLFDQFAKGSNTSLEFTNADVSALLKSIGTTNKQYLFTDKTQNMAFVVKQDIGKETQDGRKVYHYKVGVDKSNLKAYVSGVCNDFKNSNVGKMFQSYLGSTSSPLDCTSATNSIDSLDTSQSADVWVDLQTKLIHKIRFSEKGNANNYLDIGQNYTGGDTLPFSFVIHNKSGDTTTTTSVNLSLNTTTNTFKLTGGVQSSGSDAENGSFDLSVTPTNKPSTVTAPTGAKNIIQLLDDLGIPSLFNADNTTVTDNSPAAQDTTRQTDINALQSQMEAYFAENGKYPTLADMNSTSWVATNLKGLDTAALCDPKQTSPCTLAVAPAAGVYAYAVKHADNTACDNAAKDCDQYTLTATLNNGSSYTKSSLN